MKTTFQDQLQPLVHLGARSTVSANEIVLLRSDSNYTYITLNDGTTILSSTTMGVLEERLKAYSFFRPNRSTVVNLQYVNQIQTYSKDKASLSLHNESNNLSYEIKISRRRQADFLQKLN